MIADKRWEHVGIIVVMLLIAGCSGVFPAENDGAERDPYGVDDEVNSSDDINDTATPSESEDLVPGLTPDGVRSPATLLDHHYDTIEAESDTGTYVAVENMSRSVNGSLVQDKHIQSVTQHPERWHKISHTTTFEQNASNNSTRETWAENGELLIRERSSNGSVEYRNQSLRSHPEHPLSPHRQLDVITSAVHTQNPNVTVDEQQRNGTRWYIVTGTNEQEAFTEAYTLYIREDGFIGYAYREAVIEGEDGGSEQHEYALEYEFYPDTTLERPDWYDDALETTVADDE